MHEPAPPAVTGVDPTLCPICGQPNGCGAARGEATCWCETAVIPAEVLERIPVEARGRACVCRECAGVRTIPQTGLNK
jgi:hypothetical protein